MRETVVITGAFSYTGRYATRLRLSQWLAENGDSVGRKYASEVARHYEVCGRTGKT